MAICLRPSLSPPTAGGRNPPRASSAGGKPLAEGSRRARPSAENFTKAQLLPRKAAARVLPRPGPAGSRCCPKGAAKGMDGEAERKRRGSGRAGGYSRGGGRQRAAAVSGNLGRGVLRSASTHRGRHQARREGRRALSPALKSHRRPSLFSQHFIGGCFISISSFHPREKTHHPPPPPPKNSTSTSVYLWKKE